MRLWDCKSQSTKPIQILDEAKDSVSSVNVSGHEVATGSVDGRVRLYDLRMGMVYVDVVGRMYPMFTCILHCLQVSDLLPDTSCELTCSWPSFPENPG